ncbi:hypothetical protein [Bifidobacterium criceti]|uniref:Uncharacterized protein n=1 Tax=Bifidobacterium criceti TaxID=1960969 RepID=A0A2A2EH61_9BIFI|nr:hypothetical protein [Bifidobacterium criceti]PAU68403.1 hypothetical protein B1526_0588 [Bifidobacterium criceti]
MGWFSDDERYRVKVKHMFQQDEVLASGVSKEEAERIRRDYTGPGTVIVEPC